MQTCRLSVRIDISTRQRLSQRARIEAKGESEIVREALVQHLEKAPGSAFDVLMNAGGIGIAKGLPSDLSTNKKHMEGFGRHDRTRSTGRRAPRRDSSG